MLEKPKSNTDSSTSEKVKKIRLTLEFSPRSSEVLEKLKEKTDATSATEVIKNALKLYDGIVNLYQSDAEFLIKDKQGNISSFKMFL